MLDLFLFMGIQPPKVSPGNGWTVEEMLTRDQEILEAANGDGGVILGL